VSDGEVVTVVAISYNQERFVVECLESIRSQTYPHVELVVLDDASTDGSPARIRRWLDETGTDATFLALDSNLGICGARNRALDHAHGEFVSFISADDWWLPEKLSHQVEVLASRPEAAVVYGDAMQVDVRGRPIVGTVLETCDRDFLAPPEGDIFDALLVGNFVAPGPLVRRRCLEEVGPYDESLSYEDWDMWLRFARRFEFAFTPTVDVVKRSVPGSLWNARLREHRTSDIRIMLKHVDAHPELWRRIAMLAYETGVPDRRSLYLRCLRERFSSLVLRFWLQSVVGVERERALAVKARLPDRLTQRRTKREATESRSGS
jgi:glycosyltransferase involved in cell wall biosynthesis